MRGMFVGVVVILGVGCVSSTATDPLSSPPPENAVRVDAEPPGANCSYGGVAIHSGLDLDDDGVLEDSEIMSTQYVCNGSEAIHCPAAGTTHTGTVTVASAADAMTLDGVTCLDGDLIVTGLVGELPTFPDLQIVTGEVVVAGNPTMTSLNGFAALDKIGQAYSVEANASLTDLGEIASLTKIQTIWIIGNDALQDVAGLLPMTRIDGGITISNNAGLTSLHGLENVTEITNALTLDSNRNLTDLSALANLGSVYMLDISSNAALTDISLPALAKITVRMIISADPELVTISLPQLVTMNDGVTIQSNPKLASIAMPSFLTTAILTIINSPMLASVDLSAFTVATVDVNLMNLPALSGLDLGSLISIGGKLAVVNTNAQLFAGMAQLHTVGALAISNGGLVDFTGLGALAQISGDFTVAGCPQLTSFAGLTTLADVGGNLTITQNPVLPLATAQTFASSIAVHGTVAIN